MVALATPDWRLRRIGISIMDANNEFSRILQMPISGYINEYKSLTADEIEDLDYVTQGLSPKKAVSRLMNLNC